MHPRQGSGPPGESLTRFPLSRDSLHARRHRRQIPCRTPDCEPNLSGNLETAVLRVTCCELALWNPRARCHLAGARKPDVLAIRTSAFSHFVPWGCFAFQMLRTKRFRTVVIATLVIAGCSLLLDAGLKTALGILLVGAAIAWGIGS